MVIDIIYIYYIVIVVFNVEIIKGIPDSPHHAITFSLHHFRPAMCNEVPRRAGQVQRPVSVRRKI